MNDMNLSSETGMSLRSTHRSLSPGLNLNSSMTPQRPRLPLHLGEEIFPSSPNENTSTDVTTGNLLSPLRQQSSRSTILPRSSRLIQQLPGSPTSLLLNPLIKKANHEQAPILFNNDDETNLIEQIDQYFVRRRQYLQHNIDVSLNMSIWVLENIVFYSIETLKYVLKINLSSD